MQRSVKDIRQSLGVPDVLDFRGAHEGAPVTSASALDEALEYRQRVLAQGIIGATGRHVEAETDAAATEAELKKTKAEVELMELRGRMEKLRSDLASVGGGGSGMDNVLAQIVNLMREDKSAAMAQIEDLRTQLMTTFQDQITSLREQVFARATEVSPNGHGPSTALDQIQQAKGLLEVVKDLFPPQPVLDLTAGARNLDDLVKLHALQEDHEERMMRLRMEARRLDADLTDKTERAAEDKRRGEALTDAIGRAVPYAEKLASDFGSRMFGRGETASPGVSEPVSAPFGPGTRVAPCQQCKSLIGFPPGEDIAKCPNCDLPHRLEMEEPPASQPPAPATPPAAATAQEEPPEEAPEETSLHVA